MNEIREMSASETVLRVKSQELSAVETSKAALARLDEVNPQLNAVVESCHDSALEDADKLDRTIAKEGPDAAGQLAGVPITVKVNIDQADHHTTNGLQLQKNLAATVDSPVIANLKAAGAIIIGRTNTPAFSMRWFTRNSLHGATLNPLNPALTPGGSSGGAASAVAAGIGSLAHGTDIAGSVRYPAFACGVHGLRPSLGRVPVHNASGPDRFIGGQLMAVSGPLARTIDDLELAFAAMAGSDAIKKGGNAISARDPWWTPVPLQLPEVAKRVALTRCPRGTPKVAAPLIDAMDRAALLLESQGWQVEEVECPSVTEAARLNMAFWMAEMEQARTAVAEENDADANFIFEQLNRRSNEFVSPGTTTIELFQQRATLTRQWQEFLAEYPVMLCPPSAELPFEDHLDVKSEADFDHVFDAQLIQIGLPLMGIPGLHVTTGHVINGEFSQKAGTPTSGGDSSAIFPAGVQLVGQRFREDSLLAVARLLEMEIPVVNNYSTSQ